MSSTDRTREYRLAAATPISLATARIVSADIPPSSSSRTAARARVGTCTARLRCTGPRSAQSLMPDNLSEQCSHNGPNAVRLGSMLDQDLLPLTNRRARIRPLRHADAEVYAAGTEDPLVRQFAHLPEDRYTSASVRAVIDQVAAPA